MNGLLRVLGRLQKSVLRAEAPDSKLSVISMQLYLSCKRIVTEQREAAGET